MHQFPFVVGSVVVAHDIDRIWTEINKLKESAEEKQASFEIS
jgi:hypothetical protein